MKTWYALKSPAGAIYPTTVASNRRNVWAYAGFARVCSERPGFQERYWKRWEPSLRAARRLGYRIVPVEVVDKS